MRNRFHIVIVLAVVALVFGLIHICIAAEPTVTLLSPSPGQTISGRAVEVAVGYNTGSNQNVTHIELYLNSKRQDVRELDDPKPRGIISFLLDSTKTDNGSHTISAKIFAGSKLIGSVSGAVRMDNSGADITPPSVRFVHLDTDGVWSGSREIQLEVEDDGDLPPVVSLLVDKTIRGIKNKPPYEFTLNTEEMSDGSYEIEAVAVDAAGNQSSATAVRISVDNTPAVSAVASAPAEPDVQDDVENVTMADSSIAHVFENDIVTTLDPETGIPVSSEPVVPVSSLPSLVALPAVSTTSGILATVVYAEAPAESSAANVALQPDVLWSAATETMPLQNDVSVIAALESRVESADGQVDSSTAGPAIGPPSETAARLEAPVLAAAAPLVATADIPVLAYLMSTPVEDPQMAPAEVGPPVEVAVHLETPALFAAASFASMPDTGDVAYQVSTPVEDPQMAPAEVGPPVEVAVHLETPALFAAASVGSMPDTGDVAYQVSTPVEDTEMELAEVGPPVEVAVRLETPALLAAASVASMTDSGDVAYQMSVPVEDLDMASDDEDGTLAAVTVMEPPSATAPVVETPALPATASVAGQANTPEPAQRTTTPVEEPKAIPAALVEITEMNSVASLPAKTPPLNVVALREILQRAGMKVSWLPNGGVITASNPAHNIEFQIGTDEVLVDNRVVVLSRKIETFNGQVMAPITLFKELGIPEPRIDQESP